MSRNNKSKRTKAQRKIMRLKRAAKRFGLDNFYFFVHKYQWRDEPKYAFSKNNLKPDRAWRYKSIKSIEELLQCLSDDSGSIINLDTKEEFSSPKELRVEMLILSLAGIK